MYQKWLTTCELEKMLYPGYIPGQVKAELWKARAFATFVGDFDDAPKKVIGLGSICGLKKYRKFLAVRIPPWKE